MFLRDCHAWPGQPVLQFRTAYRYVVPDAMAAGGGDILFLFAEPDSLDRNWTSILTIKLRCRELRDRSQWRYHAVLTGYAACVRCFGAQRINRNQRLWRRQVTR